MNKKVLFLSTAFVLFSGSAMAQSGNSNCPIATTAYIGCVRPDGTSISISNGTISGIPPALVVGTTVISGGTNGRIEYNNNGVLGELATTGSNNVVLATSPTIASPTITGAFTATGLVTNADLANSSVTVNGTSIALGASGTVTAAAGTLTGGTLAAGVTASSLTSVGILSALTVSTLVNSTSSGNSGFAANGPASGFNMVQFNKADGTRHWTMYELMGVAGAQGNLVFEDTANGHNFISATLSTEIATWGSTTYANCTALTTSSGVMGCTASDKRIKNDEGVISPEVALREVLVLPDVHKFTYKPGHYGPAGQHIGFFAQDVRQSWPGLVSKGPATKLTPDGELQFDKVEFGPLALAAIKAQQAEIDTLKKQIAFLYRRH